jgi:hypothetical protein
MIDVPQHARMYIVIRCIGPAKPSRVIPIFLPQGVGQRLDRGCSSKNPKKNKGAKPKYSKSSKGKAHKGKGAAPPKAKVSRKGRAVEASAPAPAESGSPAKKSRKKARKA